MAAQFQFIIRSGPSTGKIYPLEMPEIIIGRDESNGVAINDAEVSRKHAKLSLHDSGYVIQDLGSTNGTFINGQRITGTQVLNPGDTVSFGENIVLMYEAAYDPNATVIASSLASRTVAPVRRPVPVPTPAPIPAPTPAPAPFQAYSGQVPAGPVPMATSPAKKSVGRVVVILLVLLLVCLTLACIAIFFWLDSDKTGARWCTYPLNLIINIIGPLLGYGTCP